MTGNDVLDALQSAESTHLPKHMRLRYWTSQEELALLECWRQHFSAVVAFDKNYPIFRAISDEMREQNFNLNPQECRRRINIYNNKYSVERRRLEADPEYVSDWRLYPMLHSMLKENADNELDHMHKVVNELIASIPKEKFNVGKLKNFPKFKGFPNSCFTYPLPLQIKPTISVLADGTMPTNIEALKPRIAAIPRRMSCLMSAQPVLKTENEIPALPIVKRRYTRRKSIDSNQQFRVRMRFTNENLMNLRINNNYLAEQLIISGRKLKTAEQNYKDLERLLESWLQQQQQILKKLE